MNDKVYNTEAIEATAKAALNNTVQVVDLALSKSAELLEKNVQATRDTVERQANFVKQLRDVKGVEEFVKAQENFSKQEAAAIEGFSRDVYKLTNEAATDLAGVSDNQGNAASDIVTESLENLAQSIPNGSAQPYGGFLREAVRSQINAFQTFNSMVEKALDAQRTNFNTIADAVGENAAAASAKGKKANKKR